MSGAATSNVEVSDSITSVEVEQMQGLSVKDSIVTINVGGQDGPRSIADTVTEFRHKIRDLHQSGDKDAARRIDATIDELRQQAVDQQAAGLPSSAAAFHALQGLGHLRRGRADKMAQCISESLSLDPHCEQAHLIAGEYAHQQGQRMSQGPSQNSAILTAISHHNDVWNHASSSGARNNAGYHLCLELRQLGRLDEAQKIKQELLQNMTNPEGRARVEAIDI